MIKGVRKHLGKQIEKVVGSLRKEDTLSQIVVNFKSYDENSMKCPDKKKEKLRYWRDCLQVLHEKF